ncbi:MAG: hypothetical protein PHR43_05425 [Dehalococcoidales bacterium]|nr:hypothetical protein [Dehalococcoidales bacterium]
MSKLIEQMENMVKGTPSPIGFRAAPAGKSKARPLLVADVTVDIKKMKDYLAGADAVLLPAGAKTSNLPDIPRGSRLADTDTKTIEAAVKSGADFVVFTADSAVFTPGKDSKLGRIIQIDNSITDSLLRTVGELPVDAILVDSSKKDSLTWNDLMALQRFAAAGKPLMLAVSGDLTSDELKTIWNAGADGIVVGIGTEAPVAVLADLRKEMDKLEPRAKKSGKTEALLPLGRTRPEAEPEPEEEEEEEE